MLAAIQLHNDGVSTYFWLLFGLFYGCYSLYRDYKEKGG